MFLFIWRLYSSQDLSRSTHKLQLTLTFAKPQQAAAFSPFFLFFSKCWYGNLVKRPIRASLTNHDWLYFVFFPVEEWTHMTQQFTSIFTGWFDNDTWSCTGMLMKEGFTCYLLKIWIPINWTAIKRWELDISIIFKKWGEECVWQQIIS